MDRWEYLLTREYKIRHHICKYFLEDVDGIIDVGAYKHTIDWSNVVAIDPLGSMPDSFHGTISEWVKQPYHNDIRTCGVVALGLEIEGGEDEWDSFINLIRDCKIAIIEYSVEHNPSVYQKNKIMLDTDKKIVAIINFEFKDVDTKGFTPHKKRELIVLERQ